MVFLGAELISDVCSGSSSFKIEAITNWTFDISFKLCNACQKAMAAIPPSAFSAGRIRESQQKDMKVCKPSKGEPGKFFNTNLMELTPLKYNSKLMNSIWGLYNRYSPHNVKNVNDARSSTGELQQLPGSSNSNKTDSRITLPSGNLDNVWAAMNVSQSH